MKKEKNTPRGNYTKIDPKNDIVPLFLNNNIVSKHPQDGNKVPCPPVENSILAKIEVDENHK